MKPEELRSLITFLSRVTYLDSASVVPAPAPVWKAMEQYAQEYPLNYGVGEFPASVHASVLVDQARSKMAAFIHARQAEEIIFTKNTTEAINLVVSGGPWEKGDEIILTTLEHQSNLMPWIRLQKERGVLLRFAQAEKDGTIKPESIQALVTPRTKLINVTYVSNIYGTVTPVEEIGQIAQRSGSLYMIDAAQAGGRLPIDVQKANCDFMSLCGRKSLMGPQGTGALYVRKEILTCLRPMMLGSRAGHVLDENTISLNEAPYRFESGVLNTSGVIGLGAALDILSDIGLEKISSRIRDLTQYMIDGLLSLPHVELYGKHDADNVAGTVSWNVPGSTCSEVASYLGKEQNIAVASGSQGALMALRPLGVTGVVRSSVHYFSSKEDIDALIEGLRNYQKNSNH